jgi:hypothetical protein
MVQMSNYGICASNSSNEQIWALWQTPDLKNKYGICANSGSKEQIWALQTLVQMRKYGLCAYSGLILGSNMDIVIGKGPLPEL